MLPALALVACSKAAPSDPAPGTTAPAPAATSADTVSAATEPAYDAGHRVIGSDKVDGAALRKRHVARLKQDRSPVTVLSGKTSRELGEAICERVMPRRPKATPILLKPNLCGFDGIVDPDKRKGDDGVVGRTTDVDFTRGVVACLKKRGHDRITIAEGCGISHEHWKRVVALTGYERMAKEECVRLVAVDEDGVVYVGNLAAHTATNNDQIYRWEKEAASATTVAFQGVGETSPLPGARIGDSFDVIGGGVDTRLVAGYGSSPSVAGNNGFALFDTEDGVNYTSTSVSISTPAEFTAPPAGEFRLGVTFVDSDTVAGKSSLNPYTVVDVAGSTGTVVQQSTTDGQVLRPMDFAVVDGRSLMAIVEASNGTTDPARARIFVYDMSDPSLPLVDRKIAEASALPSAQVSNPNAVGQVKFGAIDGNVATIYAMSTNNGIQAFTLTLDPVVTPADDADFNGDLAVDGTDFLIWQRGFGLSAQIDKSTGDADGDGNVNDADLAIWTAQFGTTSTPPAIGAVPEPATLALAAAGVACLAVRRRNN